MQSPLIWALMAQVLLTLIVAFYTLYYRVYCYRQKHVKLSYFKHNQGDAPEKMLRCNDNLQNQFELPILFYLLVVLVLIFHYESAALIWLSWVFVASRYAHAFIHIKSNHIGYRLGSFLIGFISVIVMYVIFILNLL